MLDIKGEQNENLEKNNIFCNISTCIYNGDFPTIYFLWTFKKVRNVVVTSAMGTGNHRYIAKIFFSDKKINEIMKEDTESLNDNLNINNLNSKSVEIRNVNNDNQKNGN